MAGEDSKRIGENGEKMAQKFLRIIGWKNLLSNVSIKCSSSTHQSSTGNQKESHGDDFVYLYNTPFHDDTTIVVHISVKNKGDSYSASNSTIRSEFKKHIKELEEIVECAQNDSTINSAINNFDSKENVQHIGMLLWLHSDKSKVDQNILHILNSTEMRLELKKTNVPYYVLDMSRVNFILSVIQDVEKRSCNKKYQFYFPKIGTSIKDDLDRKGDYIPVELMVSDIFFVIINGDECYMYVRESFNEDSFKYMTSYALSVFSGLPDKIHIGFSDYNKAQHSSTVQTVGLNFSNRSEEIIPFSYNYDVLSLLEK